MRVILTLVVVVAGFLIGLVLGNKIMIAMFNIPTRMVAEKQGKTLWWDLTLLISAAIVIGFALAGVDWLYSGPVRSMAVPMPAIASWLFAAWWFLVGIRDYSLLRYDAEGGGVDRYKKPLPLVLSWSAGLDLALLGYFITNSQREWIALTLIIFVVLWSAWSTVATRGRREIKETRDRKYRR